MPIVSKNRNFFILSFGFLILSCSHAPNKTKDGPDPLLTESVQVPFQDPEIDTWTMNKIIGDFEVNKIQLKNGLKMLLVSDHASPTFAYYTFYNVGSRNEVPGKTGLAHFFEHMMFKGTVHHPDGDFFKLSERAGAERQNASTSENYTKYIQELPRSGFPLIVGLESDRMHNLEITQNSFSTEREVIQNERRFRNENSPLGFLFQKIQEMSFEGTPSHYAWPVIGYEKDLLEMTAQDAVDFYQAHYRPSKATVVAVGDLSIQNMKDEIIKKYSVIKDPERKAPEVAPVRYSDFTKKMLHQAKVPVTVPCAVQNEKLLAAYIVPESDHQDQPALNVLQKVLSQGRSSRLHRALVDTEIASSYEVSGFGAIEPDLMVILVDLQAGKNAQLANQIVQEQLKALQSTLISQQELERVKNQEKYEYVSTFETYGSIASYLGFYETVTGDLKNGAKLHEQIQKVTPESVQRVAKIYFNPDQQTTLIGVPQK